jgi:hypothetical protein
MVCAVFLLDAVLPLRPLWFHEALLTQLGIWSVLPALWLFPGHRIIPPVQYPRSTGVPTIGAGWEALLLLAGVFFLVFALYLCALRYLPTRISRRFLLGSTLLLGIIYLLIPVVTSTDLFSYIAYARAGVVYHLNPLTVTPMAIQNDVVFRYIGWVDQPSAYGPTWIALTCLLQWLLDHCYLRNSVLAMVLALRCLGLAAHMGSVLLIWSLSGILQRRRGQCSLRRRMLATLAFAWNPLLLLEACTNAHCDTVLLFLLLFLLRTLVYTRESTGRLPAWLIGMPGGTVLGRSVLSLLPAFLLALGVCLKINLLLLAPGLLLYQWRQERGQSMRVRVFHVAAALATCLGVVVVCYAPFWQGGAVLRVFQVNPAVYRTINSLPNSLSHLYNGLVAWLGFPLGAQIGSPAEHKAHALSLALFALLYAALCWRAWRTSGLLGNLYGLVYWMALVWLCYSACGSPWYWPWYLTTFFGLYALLESAPHVHGWYPWKTAGRWSWLAIWRRPVQLLERFAFYPATVRVLTLSMLTLYCFTTWAAQHSFLPVLPGFLWSSLSGAWIWLLPLCVFRQSTGDFSVRHLPVDETEQIMDEQLSRT